MNIQEFQVGDDSTLILMPSNWTEYDELSPRSPFSWAEYMKGLKGRVKPKGLIRIQNANLVLVFQSHDSESQTVRFSILKSRYTPISDSSFYREYAHLVRSFDKRVVTFGPSAIFKLTFTNDITVS